MKLTHVSLMVRNQDEALDFFTNKLGFEKRDDMPMGPDRWLTVGCSGQSLEIILEMPNWNNQKASTQEREAIIGKQGFCFSSSDIQAEYNQLKAKGITIVEPPTQQNWGMQLIFQDLYGNTHVLVESKNTT